MPRYFMSYTFDLCHHGNHFPFLPSAFGVSGANPGLSEQRSAYEISRSPELHRAAADRVEACERALAVWPPFLRALAVSPPPFSPSPSAPRSSSRFHAELRINFYLDAKKVARRRIPRCPESR